MAAKTANLYARIEPDVKEQAEKILDALGIPASNAINMFYKQIVLHRGIPFELTLPAEIPNDISRMSEAEFHAEIEKGIRDVEAGRTKPAREVFASLYEEYHV